MNSSMRILYLEDNPVDVELSRAALEKDGLKYEMTVVDTREDYVAALEAGGYDLILADYHLPSFDGMGALEIAREKYSWLPFIFVSGMMGEEIDRIAQARRNRLRAQRAAGAPAGFNAAGAGRGRGASQAQERGGRARKVARRAVGSTSTTQGSGAADARRSDHRRCAFGQTHYGKWAGGAIWRHEFSPSINLEEFKAGGISS